MRVKQLEWRTASDHPDDYDGACITADGIGGKYAIVPAAAGFSLRPARDGSQWRFFTTKNAAMMAAQTDFQEKVRELVSIQTAFGET